MRVAGQRPYASKRRRCEFAISVADVGCYNRLFAGSSIVSKPLAVLCPETRERAKKIYYRGGNSPNLFRLA